MMKMPAGFSTRATAAGIKYPERNDLAAICSEYPCSYAGVFTSNRVFAPPVKLCRERLGQAVQAVVINTGIANACTGEQGYRDAVEICTLAEQAWQLPQGAALSLSTGVIGMELPMERIRSAFVRLVDSPVAPEEFARAIMTTDTRPKLESRTVKINGRPVTVSGFAKGAGMISPDMATMLAFVVTDLQVESAELQELLRINLPDTFNAVTVDGDMSTNDSLVVLANGASGAALTSPADRSVFQGALFEILEALAKEIVKDGEGATKLIEIEIAGAATPEDAEKAGRAIANSLLVKTAFFGNDPNWGRVICAAGYSGAVLEEKNLELWYHDRVIFKGKPVPFDKQELAAELQKTDEIFVRLDLGNGSCRRRFFTCDLSYDYVKINAEYTT